MRLKITLTLVLLLSVCFISSIKADTAVTTQTFNLANCQSWNIQDIYHNNTIIAFTVVSGTLIGNGSLNYNDINGTMTITPINSDIALTVSANSTNFVGFFDGSDLTGGALSLPANVTSTVTWQWIPSTTTEENTVAYVIVAVVLAGTVIFALSFVMMKRRQE